MLLYYITDRSQFAGNGAQQKRRLLEKIAEAAAAGVDYIQLRENDLSARELEALAMDASEIIRATARPPKEPGGRPTRLLINSRTDVAFAAHADGVHLPANNLSPSDVRNIWRNFGARSADGEFAPIISVSAHTQDEVGIAALENADLTIFAPVFEKKAIPEVTPAGIEALRQATRHHIPVLALGGITLKNAPSCLKAGASGIAAIRLFQDNQIAEVVCLLRN